ncbi:MAG: DUF4224 domain-containing protein [Patescibacteria group bacterium]|nr:DUF4224 domain-containing protein [Patescibacteria group bacterium]
MLTPDEMIALSGYRKPSCQIEWLKQHGIPHYVGADGYPRVVRAHLEDRRPQRSRGPDLEAVRRLGKL